MSTEPTQRAETVAETDAEVLERQLAEIRRDAALMSPEQLARLRRIFRDGERQAAAERERKDSA